MRSWNTTQAQAARRLGITQPRLNDLLHGKINKFFLDIDDLGNANGTGAAAAAAPPPPAGVRDR